MSGRSSHHDRREQSPKQPRGNARGHGRHHRADHRGAPRVIASGKDRTMDTQRHQGFSRLHDEELADLSNFDRQAELERRVEHKGDEKEFGAELRGLRAHGTVIEVRKGNFLTRIDTPLPSGGEGPGVRGNGFPLPPGGEGLGVRGSAVPDVPKILRCVLRGTMQQFDMGLSSLVAAGDEVELIVSDPPLPGSLHQVERHGILLRVAPRRSEFRRLHPSGRSVQTLAANCDVAVLVTSCAEPDFRPGFVDRVMVCAASSGLPVALVLNKVDLGISDETGELLDVYRALGVPVFLTSVKSGSAGILPAPGFQPDASLTALKSWMNGKRCVLTGHSGVGKSSLMLALDPALNIEDVRTGEVSTQTKKGTHTTTHAKLFEINFGNGTHAEVIDTPGVREFTPAETDRRNLWGWFPEMAKLQGQCTYADCAHLNEKGCAVRAAVERGEIHPRRYQSYVRIYETLPQ